METVYKFLKILNQIQISDDIQNDVNILFEKLEALDVDLCIPIIKKNKNFSQEIKIKIINTINYYYDYIDSQINNFSCDIAKSFLTKLKSEAKELEFLFYN